MSNHHNGNEETPRQVTRDEILERLRERILRFAASRWWKDQAEDLTQEVLVVLHEKYRELDRIEDLLPVALEITRFKIMATRRKAVRRGETTPVSVDDLPLKDSTPDPSEIAEREQDLRRLENAIARLGERCRELFRLKLQGFTFAEILPLVNAGSLNTLYTWDFRCRKELLNQMGGVWDPTRAERRP